MIKKLTLVLLLLINSISWSQIQISGIVVDKYDKTPFPGVTIIEKGTRNGTITDIDGLFSLQVSSENAILKVSYIGHITQEVKLNGKRTIEIKIQSDCTRDWFDKQHIGFYINSGVINNPIGGHFLFSLPEIIGEPTLKTEIGYQTNLKENKIFDLNFGAYHLFASCYFDTDLIVSYKNLDYNNEIELTTYSIESNLNFNKITTIIGLQKIDFNNTNKIGPTIGLGTWIGHPFALSVSAKTTIFNNLSLYEAEINRSFKGFYGFMKYYKIQDFNELSLGIGFKMIYRTKRQKISNQEE